MYNGWKLCDAYIKDFRLLSGKGNRRGVAFEKTKLLPMLITSC